MIIDAQIFQNKLTIFNSNIESYLNNNLKRVN